MTSDAFYTAISHLIDEVIYVHDEERNIIFVSPSIEHVLGYEVDKFIWKKSSFIRQCMMNSPGCRIAVTSSVS